MDVGSGAGANLRHFRRAERVILVEPDRYMRARLKTRLGESPVPVEVSDAGFEFTEVSGLEAPAVALATPIIAGTAVPRPTVH